MDMGDSAPGVVFKTLSKALYKYADVDVLSPKFDKCDTLEGIGKTRLHHYRSISWPDIKKLWKYFRFNYNDLWWIMVNLYPAVKSLHKKKYHGVISFTSMNFFPSIRLGKILARILDVPWSIYSVDGIPSPVDWLDGDDEIHALLSAHIDRCCRNADFMFSSNKFMMAYQKQICHSFAGKWSYLYTPYKQKSDYARSEHKDYNFLYTGSLYGLRRVDGILAGFRLFLQDYSDSKLIFVGAADQSFFDSAQDLIRNGNVIVHPFSRDLTAYYQDADVLVDIGADIPDDVFLSSKIVSYLSIDRPILAVTGNNSPVRNIMGGLQSIIHCSNQESGVYRALQDCIAVIGKGIEDRVGLLDEFDPDTIARKLFDTISSNT